MAYRADIRTRFYDLFKQQRQVLSGALIVALFLILVGHVPMLPVIAGCFLAVGFSVLRSSNKLSHVRSSK